MSNKREKKQKDAQNFTLVNFSGVKSSPEIYLSKSIVTDGGNYLK